MPTISGFDAHIYWFDNSAAAYGADPGATACYELEPVDVASIGLNFERLKKCGLGSRVRIHKDVIKDDPKFSLEMAMVDDANYNWTLAKMVQDTTGTTPSQCAFLIWLDTNRNGTRDAAGTDIYFWTFGALADELEISSEVNAETKLKVTFNVQRWQVSTTASASFITFNTAAGALSTFIDANIAKTAGTWTTAEADVNEISSWKVNVKNNITKRYGWTNNYSRSAEKGGFDITGSITIDLHDVNEINELINETGGTLTLTLEAGSTATLTGVYYDTLDFDLSENELVEQEIAFTADNVTLV